MFKGLFELYIYTLEDNTYIIIIDYVEFIKFLLQIYYENILTDSTLKSYFNYFRPMINTYKT